MYIYFFIKETHAGYQIHHRHHSIGTKEYSTYMYSSCFSCTVNFMHSIGSAYKNFQDICFAGEHLREIDKCDLCTSSESFFRAGVANYKCSSFISQ